MSARTAPYAPAARPSTDDDALVVLPVDGACRHARLERPQFEGGRRQDVTVIRQQGKHGRDGGGAEVGDHRGDERC